MTASPSQRARILGYAMSVFTGILAGLLYAVNKALTTELTPAQITFLEAAVACALLVPGYLWRARGQALPRQTPWGWLLLFGLTAVMLFYMRTTGIALTSATTGALVVRLEVGLVFVYSYLFLRERPSPWGWVGAGLLVVGMLAALDLPAGGLVLRPLGLAALVAAAFGIAANAVIIKLRLGGVSNSLTALANVTCQVMVLGPLIVLGGQLTGLGEALTSPRTAVLLGLGGFIVTWMLTTYYYAMKRVPMWTVRLLGLVTPAAALLADYFWLRSAISGGQLLGLVLVTAGSALVIIAETPAAAVAEGVHS
ncbi:MAG: DMT family transporter [Armatimonadetes bacterium]|nr:DMT family transporter [Armatimonadota bacterium]